MIHNYKIVFFSYSFFYDVFKSKMKALFFLFLTGMFVMVLHQDKFFAECGLVRTYSMKVPDWGSLPSEQSQPSYSLIIHLKGINRS